MPVPRVLPRDVDVTTTSPALADGAVPDLTTTREALCDTMLASTPHSVTAVTSVPLPRLVPSTVTVVPPSTGPDRGVTAVIADGGTAVYWKAPLSVAAPRAVVTVTSHVPAAEAAPAVTT